MSSFVISNKYPCFADELSKMGHNVIYCLLYTSDAADD